MNQGGSAPARQPRPRRGPGVGAGPTASPSAPVPSEPNVVLATSKKPEEGARLGKAKSRCTVCRRKVGLMGLECPCGRVFYGAHRYLDRHGYSYKDVGHDTIARDNPVIRADKVDKL